MIIKVDLYDEWDDSFVNWSFWVNGQGYLVHKVGLGIMENETLYELGKIKESELENKVMYLINCWKAVYKNFKIIKGGK